MILYYYSDIDKLDRIVTTNNQGVACVKIRFKHRSSLNDDSCKIFGCYVLPRCVAQIENELGVDGNDSLMPLFKDEVFMESVLRASKAFDDKSTGLSQFVVSLYEDIDNLDLWFRYGGGGRGISVGLDTEKLKLPFGPVFNSLIRECIYWPKGISNNAFLVEVAPALYGDIKEVYQSTTDSRVKESFKKLCTHDIPEIVVNRRIKETLLHNLINTFDLFNKYDDWKGEKEHRMTASVMGNEISYEENAHGDYCPFIEVEFPIDALKLIMIGPKGGKNSYGMVRSHLYKQQVKEKIQVLQSNCAV